MNESAHNNLKQNNNNSLSRHIPVSLLVGDSVGTFLVPSFTLILKLRLPCLAFIALTLFDLAQLSI